MIVISLSSFVFLIFFHNVCACICIEHSSLEEAMVRNYTKSYDRIGGHLNIEWGLQASLGHIYVGRAKSGCIEDVSKEDKVLHWCAIRRPEDKLQIKHVRQGE
jgi:hypothetical protein